MVTRALQPHHPLPAGPGGEPERRGADDDEHQGHLGEHALNRRLVGGQVGRGLDGGLLCLELVDHGADDVGQQHTADGGAERAARDQLGPLVDRLGDRGGQRPVGDVHQGVHEPECGVGDVGVEQLGGRIQPGRHVEDHGAQRQQRDRPEHEVRAKLPPPGHRPVHRPTRDQVSDPVPQTDDQEHGADRGRRDPGHVGVVVQQERGGQAECQVEAEVTGPVAQDCLERQSLQALEIRH